MGPKTRAWTSDKLREAWESFKDPGHQWSCFPDNVTQVTCTDDGGDVEVRAASDYCDPRAVERFFASVGAKLVNWESDGGGCDSCGYGTGFTFSFVWAEVTP